MMNFRQLAVVIAVQSVPAISGGDSIYDIADNAPDFSTLVQAVNAADLDDTLSSPGTYTIFAPTNEAFEKLPSSTLKKLLNPMYKPQLTDLLLYHALGDEVLSSDLSDGMEATTLNGEEITITLNPPRINQKSKIIIEDGLYDIEASNGVIHAIDTLLTPTSYNQNIVDIADSDTDNFSTLLLAAKKAGLVDELTGDGPFTLFAPTNDAFDKLPPGTLDDLLLPANKKTLQDILLYHVVPGNIVSSELSTKSASLPTLLNGQSITVEKVGKSIYANGHKRKGAKVIDVDIIASNGVIHVIDKVLLPGTSTSKSSKETKSYKASKEQGRTKSGKEVMKGNNGKSKNGKEKMKGNNGRSKSGKEVMKSYNGKSKKGKSIYHYMRKRVGVFDRD
jgi:uncharacterized surface protein with fasciclin (FAS1) repeats